MQIGEQASRLIHILADMDRNGADNFAIYQLLESQTQEFDIAMDLLNASRLPQYRWVIPISCRTGLAVVTCQLGSTDWVDYVGEEIPRDIAEEMNHVTGKAVEAPR